MLSFDCVSTRALLYFSFGQADGRGVKDPERLKRQQKRREDAEKEALKQGPSEGGLKVLVLCKTVELCPQDLVSIQIC